MYWSERQYLILFLEFMLKHGHRSKRVICTGAGPGREVPFIAGLFPEHVFELYEEKIPFQVDHVPGKIELHSGHDGALTEEKARALGKAGARPLFIYNASPIPGVAQMDQNIERKAAEELVRYMTFSVIYLYIYVNILIFTLEYIFSTYTSNHVCPSLLLRGVARTRPPAHNVQFG